MEANDLVLDGSKSPSFDEIRLYINSPARELWDDFVQFIQQKYRSKPKITFSKCSAKPGWNVKYQKSGKSVCTLYPEKDLFIVLVVISLDQASLIENIASEFDPAIVDIIKNAKPFNGTLWLMPSINTQNALDSIKKILLIKHP
ncbi:UNVERIFIED_CONTAM: uncharacterized protein DUF3788 [Acetivibrio alkalicellulosi]